MGARERLIACFVVALAAVLAAWFLLLAPERSKLASLNTQISSEQASLASEQAQLTAGESARSSYRSAIHAIDVLDRAAPLADEIPALIRLVNRLERGHSVSWKTISFSPGTDSELPSLELVFAFASSYSNLQRFIVAFDRLTRTDAVNVAASGRLATIDSIGLTPVAGGGLSASITATVYQTAAGAGSSAGSASTVAAP